ncbi:MAG TPA: hypothetical protein VGV37_06395 [Aliidongia sp.]|uniref:hypothetical protein n=1 Tax=Aliidongia sp. TaxID=1914230 RepID=UPI002DDCDC70|nr:hypothetical protein [Aliidongia sp.]HEV2674155.1 hypothetical protein [Aliidongia sp.]
MTRFKLALAAALLWSSPVLAQQTLLQGGPTTSGHVPMYSTGSSYQPVVQDSGTAAGGAPGVGLGELALAARGTGTAPYSGLGTGPLGTNLCDYDAPTTNPTGYHYLCFSANAQGGGLIAYGAGGGASSLPLNMNINGASYSFPFTLSGVVGPNSSAIGDITLFNNTAGSLLADSGVQLSALARLASPNFTGIPTAPTATPGTSTTQIATTAFASSFLASPAFTGTPTAPTAPAGTSTTQLATTAFVTSVANNVTMTPVTATGTTTLSAAPQYVAVNKAVGSATPIVLPASSNFPNCPSVARSCPQIIVTDQGMTFSATNGAAVSAADGKTVGGLSSYSMLNAGQSNIFTLTGAAWIVN